MTSLTDVYEGEVGRVASRRQQVVGTALFLVGTAALVAAIALATTDVGTRVGLGDYAAREVGGIVAGVGLPTVVLGIFAVLPASVRTRALAVLGTGVSLLGVVAFQHIYPYNWMTSAPTLALGTSVVYFAGILTTFWCLFVALATFKTRKAPGGTARMEVTEEGTIKLVEEGRAIPGLGGIGFFGNDPDGSVETQTNRPDDGRNTVSDGGDTEVLGQQPTTPSERTQSTDAPRRKTTAADQSSKSTQNGSTADDRPTFSERDLDPTVANAGPEASPSTDGGTSSSTGHDPITDTAVHRGEPDKYCGNCRHFQYVMDDGDVEPYCTHHGKQLDDMEACSSWLNND
ncbi:DUF7139 domain-containing protein [Haloarcula amylovorans]|uniref:DUF7139 domain-containing protein n=1 Tax=Haloarcula amylovorans TaxID=2562280 RepID=UPI001076B168|nr:hypothetical protein [Halomicroarcula amylolytica]